VTVKVILKTMRCKLFTDESDREGGGYIYSHQGRDSALNVAFILQECMESKTV